MMCFYLVYFHLNMWAMVFRALEIQTRSTYYMCYYWYFLKKPNTIQILMDIVQTNWTNIYCTCTLTAMNFLPCMYALSTADSIVFFSSLFSCIQLVSNQNGFILVSFFYYLQGKLLRMQSMTSKCTIIWHVLVQTEHVERQTAHK